MHADDPEAAVVFDFIEQFQRDEERGEHFALEHYLERFPDQPQAIRREFEALTEERTARIIRGSRHGVVGRRVGPYEIVRALGRGGQGAVYLARDSRLAREVALKTQPPAAFVSEARLKRFRREAEVVASLSHPGICDVIDADFVGEVPYIAMRFVPGESLASEVDGDAPPERGDIRRLIDLIDRVGRALHVAHEAGVVHRDIKPANIIVTPEGEPVILDFGLAREVDDASITEPGAVFGTLHYMAPEQLADEPPPLDRRTDVHALAVTLYELVTARRPFAAETREVLAMKIRRQEAPDPRGVNPAVPADLSVVLAKAMEKDPDRRYPTALAFAEDLRRVLEYRPIEARPASTLLKLRRWARRHPLLSTSTALAALFLTVGLVVALVLLERVRGQRELYRAIFFATYARQLMERDPALALLTAVKAAEIDRTSLANTALYETLDACREENRLVLPERRRSIVVSDAGLRVALIARDGQCEIADLDPKGRPPWVVPTKVRSAAFDERGERLLVGCESGELQLYDAADGDLLQSLPRSSEAPEEVSFCAGESRAAARSSSGLFEVLDLESGQELTRIVAPGQFERPFAIVPDASGMVSLDPEGVLRSFDLASGEPLVTWERQQPVSVFELAPNGALVAFATESELCIADVGSGEILHGVPTPVRVRALAFDASSERLAACRQGGFSIWSTDTGELLVDRAAHRQQIIWDITFSADGRWVATGALDSSAGIFRASDGVRQFEFRDAQYHLLQVHFTPDGRRLISVGFDRQVTVHRLDDRPGLLTMRAHDAAIRMAAFSPDGTRVLSGSDDGTARVWDLEGRTLAVYDAQDAPVVRARWSPDGSRVLTVSERGALCIWGDPAGPIVLAGDEVATDAWFDAHGGVVSIADTGRVCRWEPSRPEAPGGVVRPEPFDAHAQVYAAAVSNDREYLALGYDGPRVNLVSLTGELSVRAIDFESALPSMPRPKVLALAFSPTGRYLAVGLEDTRVHLIDPSTLRPMGRCGNSTPGVLVFHPTESHFLIGSLFNPGVGFVAVEGMNQISLRDHRNRISACDFHPNGSMFLTASYDGSMRLYFTEDRSEYAEVTGHDDAISAAAFSPDGDLILTASFDGTLRLWPVDPLALARERLSRGLTDRELAELNNALDGH